LTKRIVQVLIQASIVELEIKINSFKTNAIYTDATAARVYKMQRRHQMAHGEAARKEYWAKRWK
jgi:hypothetical protein